VRIVAVTNRDLEAEVAAGRFREDRFYRLNVIEIMLPPLRHRRRDLLPLARRLLGFFARQSGKAVAGFTPEAEAAMRAYPWPGNVRELRNAVERGVILAPDGVVGLEPADPETRGGGVGELPRQYHHGQRLPRKRLGRSGAGGQGW
jgi:two-component system, NtrC family, response regulator AlgB